MEKQNLFVLGCGRSGTSLVAGLFRKAGYFMGERLYKPRDSNPLGFFEDREVNTLNEDLMRPVLPQRFSCQGIGYGADIPGPGQLWLARLPLDITLEAGKAERQRMRDLIRHAPFCFKDPRFCYTVHLWKREAPASRCLCVFRDPREVATSILKEIQSIPYLSDLGLSVGQVFEVWRLMYQHVLDHQSREGEWMFVFYDDLFRPKTLDRVESFVGAPIDRSFPRPMLKRSTSTLPLDGVTMQIFNHLMDRSAC